MDCTSRIYNNSQPAKKKKNIATPENPGLGNILEEMTLCIHHQPGEEIVLLIGFGIPNALQRSLDLRQRKRALE